MAALAERLKETPDVTFHVEEDRLTIPERQGGFEIVFTDDGQEFTVHLGTWHDHFDTPEEAIECVLFALTAQCRIRVVSRGGLAYKWTLQRYEDGEWHSGSTMAIPLVKFWRRRDEQYLSNGRS